MLRFDRVFRDGGGFDSLLVMLALGYLVVFSAFPLIYNVIMSFQAVDLFSLASFDRPYVGLDNYREVWASVSLRRSSGTPCNSSGFRSFSTDHRLCPGSVLSTGFPWRHLAAGPVPRRLDPAGLVVGAVWAGSWQAISGF